MINLTADIEGAPENPTLTYQWTVPGMAISDWTHSAIGHISVSHVVPLDNHGQLTSPGINYAWIDGGNSRQVKIAVSVNGVPLPEAAATFDVTRPNYGLLLEKGGDVEFVPGEPDGMMGLPGGTLRDSTNAGNPGNPGMIMSMTGVSSDDQANCQFWQILTSISRQKHQPAGWVHADMPGGPDTLDKYDPYPKRDGTSASDSPNIDVGWSDDKVEVLDKFTVYLMYKPPGTEHTEAIYVPMASADWSWHGQATRNGARWDDKDTVSVTGSVSPAGNKTGTPVTAYPGGDVGWSKNLVDCHVVTPGPYTDPEE